MRQYTETYRVKINLEMKYKLAELKIKYHIIPASFIRSAINEKLQKEFKKLRAPKETIKLPF